MEKAGTTGIGNNGNLVELIASREGLLDRVQLHLDLPDDCLTTCRSFSIDIRFNETNCDGRIDPIAPKLRDFSQNSTTTIKMDFSDSTTRYAAGVSLVALLAAFLLLQPTGLVKWLQKKNYQYEVTFALYMLTPTEKFIFSLSFPFLPLYLKTNILPSQTPSSSLQFQCSS